MIRCAECNSLVDFTPEPLPGSNWPSEGTGVPDPSADTSLACIRDPEHKHGWAIRDQRVVREEPSDAPQS